MISASLDHGDNRLVHLVQTAVDLVDGDGSFVKVDASAVKVSS